MGHADAGMSNPRAFPQVNPAPWTHSEVRLTYL
jgi:hypothetical protein